MSQVLITFDTEDFISKNSIWFLHKLLLSLKEFECKALFFLTGYMAERLRENAEITGLLKEHEIGYHSSSHSVRPTIFEYTDLENYDEAYKTAMVRETSHVNPLTGQIEGKGGIFAVRSLCKDKEILAFRAPGFCWSPPHIEALRDLGLKYDFSTIIAPTPVFYKGLTFYPYPAVREWQGSLLDYRIFMSSVLKRKVTVMALHPNFFVNQDSWDSIYHDRNPDCIRLPRSRIESEFASMFYKFELFLKRVKRIQKLGLVNVTPDLSKSEKNLTITKEKVEEIYERSMVWPRKFFNYEPKFLKKHFFEFFSAALSPSTSNTYE